MGKHSKVTVQSSKKTDSKHRQIVSIEGLQAQIRQHVIDINHPFSIVISTLLFPMILMPLLLDPRSPFHAIYRYFYSDQFKECQHFSQDVFANYETLTSTLNEAMQSIDKALANVGQVIQLIQGKDMSLDDTLKMLDEYRDPRWTDETAGEFKQSIISIINYYLKLFSKRQIPIDERLLPAMKIKDLYHLADKARKAIIADMPTFVNFGGKLLNKLCIRANFLQLNILPQVVLTFLFQRFIVDRALTRFFPNGLGLYTLQLSSLSTPQDLDALSKREKTALINQLQTREQLLTKKSRRNVLIARALLPILFGLCVAYAGSPVSARLWILLSCTLGAAMTGAYEEGKRFYETRVYQKQLSQATLLIQELFQNYYKTVEALDYGSLNASQIEIEFNEFKRISPKHVRQTIINVLISHGILVNQSTKEYIVLPATLQLSQTKMQNIRKDIETALDRLQMLAEFQSQLESLNRQPYISVTTIPSLDMGYLKTLEITIRTPRTLSENIRSAFSELMPTITNIDDQTIISIRGFQKIVDEKFTGLIEALSNYKAPFSEIFEEEKTSGKKGGKKKPTTSSASSAAAAPSTEPSEKKVEPVIEIEFPSGKYRTGDKEYPITRIETTRYYQHPHYTLFRLKEKDFPSIAAYKKFRTIIQESKIVRAESAQGLKFTNLQRKNRSTDTWILSSLKAKAIGEHGNIRVYAHQETASTGEILHVFDTVKVKAH